MRQELRTCTDILSDVLTFLHLRLKKDPSDDPMTDDDPTIDNDPYSDAISRDVGVVADFLLHPLVQTILVIDRQTKSAVVVRASDSVFEIGNV